MKNKEKQRKSVTRERKIKKNQSQKYSSYSYRGENGLESEREEKI